MSATTLTHKNLADSLGVSETTIKSYRRKFPGCFPVASVGKPIRFTESSLDVALRIQALFAQGMSIQEVRLRLSGEFSWISPAGEKAGRPAKELGPQDIQNGLSTLAKSMVSMGQQQQAIAKRLATLEETLRTLGAGATGSTAAPVTVQEGAKAASAVQGEDSGLLARRMDALETVTGKLTRAMSTVIEKLDTLATRSVVSAPVAATGAAAAGTEAEQQPQADELHVSNVVSFPSRPQAQPDPPQDVARHHATGASEEPPRSFFALPLLVRTADGRFINASSRGRGKLNLNDLKAMLVYGFTPPNHFSLHWEKSAGSWWLHLEQQAVPGSDRISLLLAEMQEASGDQGFIEITRLRRGEQVMHPAEISVIVESFTG